MKTLLSFLCLALVACSSVQPVQPDAAPSRTGNWRVEVLDPNRNVLIIYRTKEYRHTYYPRRISFVTNDGKPVTLTENFEVYLEK